MKYFSIHFVKVLNVLKKRLPHLNVIVIAPQVAIFSYQLVIGLKIEQRKSLLQLFHKLRSRHHIILPLT